MIGGIGGIGSLFRILDQSARLSAEFKSTKITTPNNLTRALSLELARETAQVQRALLQSALRENAQLTRILGAGEKPFDPMAPRGTYLDIKA